MNSLTVPDVELIRLIQQKNKDAAAALYDNYAKVLSLAIFRLVPDKSEGSLILQKTFVRIWCTADQFYEQQKPLLPWMLSIARGLANKKTELKAVKISA